VDYKHRLFYCLCWLNDGNFHKTREAEAGRGKSSLQKDIVHVLIAIVEGLENQVQWPDADCRQELKKLFEVGMLIDCIGVGDVKEYEIEKPKNLRKERKSFSGKKRINSYKMLSVADYTGRFIYVRVALGKNNNEVFTSALLYLQQDQFFL
jgi:hypothetical protein